MNLQTAMTMTDSRSAALGYYDAGVNIIPCTGKKPLETWVRMQRERNNRVELARWFKPGKQVNIGIVCGRISGNLVVIDLDGDAAIGLFRSKWPELMQTLTVYTGSGHGLHLYYKVKELPQTTRHSIPSVGNIEVRANGTYVIAPPSIHPDTGKKYLPGLLNSPQEVYSLQTVLDWLINMQFNRHVLKKPQEKQPIIGGASGLVDSKGNPVRNVAAYGRASLEDEISRLRRVPKGQRNIELSKSAFRLAQLIAFGALAESTIERELFIACMGWSDMSATEITNTIRSGIRGGKEKPNER